MSIITDCAFCLFFVILIASLKDEIFFLILSNMDLLAIFDLSLSTLRLGSELQHLKSD